MARRRRRRERIVALLVRSGKKPQDTRSYRAPPVPVSNAIFQDPVKQRPPFVAGAPPIGVGEADHRVLNDIERLIGIANRHDRDPKCTRLHLAQEAIEFRCVLQRVLPFETLRKHARQCQFHRSHTPTHARPLATATDSVERMPFAIPGSTQPTSGR